MTYQAIIFLMVCGAAFTGDSSEWRTVIHRPEAGYSEISAINYVSQLRHVASNSPDGKSSATTAPARVTVKVTLPPAGQTEPSRPRMVEVAESGDGTLDFQTSKTASDAVDIGIPGLLTPEFLAMDRYSLFGAEMTPLENPAESGAQNALEQKNKAEGYWPTIFLPPDLTLMTPSADIVLLDNMPRTSIE